MAQPTNEQIEKFIRDEINMLAEVSDDNILAISHNLISISKRDLPREEMNESVKEQLVHLFKEILLASNTLNAHVQIKVRDGNWDD